MNLNTFPLKGFKKIKIIFLGKIKYLLKGFTAPKLVALNCFMQITSICDFIYTTQNRYLYLFDYCKTFCRNYLHEHMLLIIFCHRPIIDVHNLSRSLRGEI